jgi:phage shock protein PspC (stress-responsive transcriptional regulator)
MTENQPTIAEPIDQTGSSAPKARRTGSRHVLLRRRRTALPPSYAPPPQPRLRRSRTDRVLTGVCGGISPRTSASTRRCCASSLVVGTVFTGGALLIAYIIAWALMPGRPRRTSPVYAAPHGSRVFAAGGTGTYVDPGTGQVYGAPVVAAQPRTEPRSYLGLFALSVGGAGRRPARHPQRRRRRASPLSSSGQHAARRRARAASSARSAVGPAG